MATRVKTAIPPASPKKKFMQPIEPLDGPIGKVKAAAPTKSKHKSLKNKSKPPAKTSAKAPPKKSKTAETKPPRKSRAKPPEEKKSPGRKPWVPDLDNIERWAMQGMEDKDIAALSLVAHTTFCTKKTELPELKEALERGRAKGIQIASGKLLEMVLKGDRDATKFYLERKAGWKQTNVIEKKKALKDMTDEELLELLERTAADRTE